jgi:hypothetical protein
MKTSLSLLLLRVNFSEFALLAHAARQPEFSKSVNITEPYSEFALLANDCDESVVRTSEFEFALENGCELAIDASRRGVSRLEDADASSALLLRASLKASRVSRKDSGIELVIRAPSQHRRRLRCASQQAR